jgi:amino acid transporter
MPRGGGGDAPLVEFGRVVAGPAGGLLLTAAALFSLTGNIMGGLTATPRATYALARDGMLPAWFGRISTRYATPANSVLFMGGLIAVLALTGSFVWLAIVSTLARMIVYAASLAALPPTQRGAGESTRAALWLLIVAGLVVCGWAALQSSWESWRLLIRPCGPGIAAVRLGALARFEKPQQLAAVGPATNSRSFRAKSRNAGRAEGLLDFARANGMR